MEYLYLFGSLIGHCVVYALAIFVGMVVNNIVMMYRYRHH